MTRSFLFALLVVLGIGPASWAEEPTAAVRILDVGPIRDIDALAPHLRWAAAHGWDAIRMELPHALDPSVSQSEPATTLLEVVELCEELELTAMLQLFPEGSPRPRHPPDYGSRRDLRSLRNRIGRWIERAPLAEWSLSFRGGLAQHSRLGNGTLDLQPTHPKQLGLAAQVHADHPDVRLWVEPTHSTTESIATLDDDVRRQVLESWKRLPDSIGVIWAGPGLVNPSIERNEIEEARPLFGSRPMLLLDRFPDGYAATAHPLSLVLAPLSGRDPALVTMLDGYLSRPMGQLGGARLSLTTVAAFFEDPEGYDPQRAIERAVNRFVGKSSEARDALRTQILEWGGAPGEHNDARFPANDERMAARSLRDPARVARWRWTELRYPERMGKLTALTDEAFRQDLLEAMSRRLAIARAIPAAQQLRQRQTEPGQWETAGKMLRTMQERLRERPLALTSLVRFLRAAGLSDTVVEPRRTER